jgi:hypothetical protein
MGSQQHLHKLLAAAGGPLAQLLHASQKQEALLAQLRQRLPHDLAAALRSASLDRGCLRLGVAGSAWATRLRFLAPQLLRRLEGWPHGPVETIEVRVSVPAGAGPSIAQAVPAPLSDASREHLEAVAQSAADPRLAAALRSLARSAQQPAGSADT